ncbi:hypothetical protein GEV33_003567 [Tenebrio molitor]|uniref:Uncharacterized protein n=1 Tax=Tenebrio molitor TaxID=7067 RepID=A0A8J6HQZ6_TENMO|nr:hypothetical protein GEV33_003567 [Tenebrio molitor]
MPDLFRSQDKNYKYIYSYRLCYGTKSNVGAEPQGGEAPRSVAPRGRSTKGQDAKGAKHQEGERSATDVGVLVDEGGCHRVPGATTVTVSVVRSAERWLVDSASAGTSRWTADDARGGWSMSPAQGPLGGALMMDVVKRKVSVKSKSLMTPSVFYDRYGSNVDKMTAPDWSGRKLWWRSRENTCAYKACGTAARAYYRTGLLVANTSPRQVPKRLSRYDKDSSSTEVPETYEGQLELENREITHAAAVRAWMEQETAEYQAEQNDVRTQATGTSRDLLLRWRAPSEVVKVLSHDRDEIADLRDEIADLPEEIADLPGTPRLQLRDSGVAAAESRRRWIHYGEKTVLDKYWTGSGRVVRPSLGAKLPVCRHSACTRKRSDAWERSRGRKNHCPEYFCPGSRLDQTSEDTLQVRKGRVNRWNPVGLHERHVSTAWASSVVLDGRRREQDEVPRGKRKIRNRLSALSSRVLQVTDELSETDYFLLFGLPEREGVMVVFEQTNRESKNAPMTHDGRVQPLSMKLNAKI